MNQSLDGGRVSVTVQVWTLPRPDAESARAIAAVAQEIEELRREPAGIVKSLPLVG